jgi:hypothetical protein
VGIEQFRVYFDKEKAGASAKDLHAFYLDLKTTFAELPEVKSKTAIEEALHEYEASHPDRCVLIPSEMDEAKLAILVKQLCSALDARHGPPTQDQTTKGIEQIAATSPGLSA